MNIKKIEEILDVLSKTRKELSELGYEELMEIFYSSEDLLDEIEFIRLKLERGIDKMMELLDEYEDVYEDEEYEEEE